jgi:hypothetical protein
LTVNDICNCVYITALCQNIRSCLLNEITTKRFSTYLRRKFLNYRLLSSVARLQLMCHLSLSTLDLLYHIKLILCVTGEYMNIKHINGEWNGMEINHSSFARCAVHLVTSSLGATALREPWPPVLFASTGLYPELSFSILQSPSLIGPLERHLAI